MGDTGCVAIFLHRVHTIVSARFLLNHKSRGLAPCTTTILILGLLWCKIPLWQVTSPFDKRYAIVDTETQGGGGGGVTRA
jgi:hypothetical protein